MFKNTCQLIFGFLCGLLLIKWVPLSFPFTLTDLMVSFVLDPLKFFAAAVVFIVGIIMNGKLIKYIFTMTVNVLRKKSGRMVQLVLCCGIVISFIILLNLGLWQSALLLCFSLLYGMISVDYKEI